MKSICSSDNCHPNVKVQVGAQTSDGIDWMRNLPQTALLCFVNRVCVRNCRKTTDSFYRLPSVFLLFRCFVVVQRDGHILAELPAPHQGDLGFSSSLTPLGVGLKRISLCNLSSVIAFAGCEFDKGKVWPSSSEPYYCFILSVFDCVVLFSIVAALCVLISGAVFMCFWIGTYF